MNKKMAMYAFLGLFFTFANLIMYLNTPRIQKQTDHATILLSFQNSTPHNLIKNKNEKSLPPDVKINNNTQTIAYSPSDALQSATSSDSITESTILKLNILLHGIGSAGDNPNPQSADLSNKDPLHPHRNVDITIIDSNNQIIKTLSDSIIYNAQGGNFTGEIDLGPAFQTGSYNIKIKSDRYLQKLIPDVIKIENMSENDLPQTDLVTGDIKNDNILNVLDYNILLDCGYGAIDPLPIADPNSIFNTQNCQTHKSFKTHTDLDDNGIINSTDYNLFLRELSVQKGD